MKAKTNQFSSVVHVPAELTHEQVEILKTYRTSLLQILEGRSTIEYFGEIDGEVFSRKIGMHHKSRIFNEHQKVQRFINDNAETVSEVEYYGTKH